MAVAEHLDVALAGVGASFEHALEPSGGIVREGARRGTGRFQARDPASVARSQARRLCS